MLVRSPDSGVEDLCELRSLRHPALDTAFTLVVHLSGMRADRARLQGLGKEKAGRGLSAYHLDRANQERERAYAAQCQQALEAHLRLAELHDHERALAMYEDHIRTIKTAEVRHRLNADIEGLTLALYRVD